MELAVRIDVQPPGVPAAVDCTPRSSGGYANQIRQSLAAGPLIFTLEHVPDLLANGRKAQDELRRNA